VLAVPKVCVHNYTGVSVTCVFFTKSSFSGKFHLLYVDNLLKVFSCFLCVLAEVICRIVR